MTGRELLEHWGSLGDKWPKVGPKLSRKAARMHQERRKVVKGANVPPEEVRPSRGQGRGLP